MKTFRIIVAIFLIGTLLVACKPQTGFHGRITDKNGKPLEGIPVKLEAANSNQSGISFETQVNLTDAKGNYSFDDQESGDYVLSLSWETSSLSCPVLEQGLPMTTIQGFLVTEATNYYAKVFIGTQTINYTKGSSVRTNLKIPCTGQEPGLPPTIDPTLLAQPAPTYAVPAQSSPQPTAPPTSFADAFTATPVLTVPPTSTPEFDVTGTSWIVTDRYNNTYDLTFLPNSAVLFQQTSPTQQEISGATWRQTGNMIFIHSDKSDWMGFLSEGNTAMTGTAGDPSGASQWWWTATKK